MSLQFEGRGHQVVVNGEWNVVQVEFLSQLKRAQSSIPPELCHLKMSMLQFLYLKVKLQTWKIKT